MTGLDPKCTISVIITLPNLMSWHIQYQLKMVRSSPTVTQSPTCQFQAVPRARRLSNKRNGLALESQGSVPRDSTQHPFLPWRMPSSLALPSSNIGPSRSDGPRDRQLKPESGCTAKQSPVSISEGYFALIMSNVPDLTGY